MAVSRVLPHSIGLIGAGVTSGVTATSGATGLIVAIVGGCFLIANSIITILLTRYLERQHHHPRKAKKKTKSTSGNSDSYPTGRT